MSKNKLHYNTITPLLKDVLKTLMSTEIFDPFSLVGGTALSLQRGHRESVDIDLFTDAEYGSLDFNKIDHFLTNEFDYCDGGNKNVPIGFGKSYFVGKNKDEAVKLDLYYVDEFIWDIVIRDGIRMAAIEEIIAMKIDVISREGRKKDFWDLHELKDEYSFDQMLDLHAKRYPFDHNEAVIKNNFKTFTNADNDFEPVCMRGKKWEIIKLDMIEFIEES